MWMAQPWNLCHILWVTQTGSFGVASLGEFADELSFAAYYHYSLLTESCCCFICSWPFPFLPQLTKSKINTRSIQKTCSSKQLQEGTQTTVQFCPEVQSSVHSSGTGNRTRPFCRKGLRSDTEPKEFKITHDPQIFNQLDKARWLGSKYNYLKHF